MEAARAQMASANAALSVAEIQLARTELHAPYAGIILSRNVEPGEVISPSQEVLSMADLSRVDLKVFVGGARQDQTGPAGRREDRTFPDKKYNGRVAYISPEGEFTPKIIQTRKERVKLVYLVKIVCPIPIWNSNPECPPMPGFDKTNLPLMRLTPPIPRDPPGGSGVQTFWEGRGGAQVSFSSSAGSIFGFVGSDGAGKTTLLRMIATMIRPSTGSNSNRRTGCGSGQVRGEGSDWLYAPALRTVFGSDGCGEHGFFHGYFRHSSVPKESSGGKISTWGFPI